jgi:hypothetical protein
MAGKFRVKANRARSSGQSASLRRNAFQINEPAGFESQSPVPGRLKVFLLGRLVVITDNKNRQNTGFSGRISRPEKAHSRDDARQ